MVECARLLGLHPVSVRVMVKRALLRLRRELVSTDPIPEVVPDAP
jgi:DNA-directed RNA polymerase specialized sigma24 family protein